MSDINQKNKALVWNYWQAMKHSGNANVLAPYLHPDTTWHGFRPLRHLNGAAEIWSQFWQPLLAAIPDLTRRPYLFMEWAPTGRKIGWNIMDFWKRDGNLLLENWIMIDLIGTALESGVDLLATLPQLLKGPQNE